MNVGRVVLAAGRVKPIWSGHPWVYAQAIDRVEGSPSAGDEVVVFDARGSGLGRGFYSPDSAIPVRLVSRNPDESLSEALLGERVRGAFRFRSETLGLPSPETTGYRLVHAEGDEIPGLVVDRFGAVAVVQMVTIGIWRRREAVLEAIASLDGIDTVVVAHAGRASAREGIERHEPIVRGPRPDALSVVERGFSWQIPFGEGQKTGFFFDQRANRELVERWSRGRRVLDVYAYVGGFALAAARGGASEVVAVERSDTAIDIGRAAAERSGLDVRFENLDARTDLGRRVDAGEAWDLVVLDPPKLAPTRRHLDRAERAYMAITANGLRLASPGGLVVSCSCSAALTVDRHLRVVGEAAQKAARTVRVLAVTGQGPDHPTPPAFGEGRYLSCVVLEVR